MVLHQISRRVVQLTNSNLKIYLGLDKVQLRLSELRLRVENKEDCFRPQFVLAFVGMKGLLRQVQRDFGGFHGELGLFQSMDCVGNLESNVLRGAPLLILVTAAAHRSIREVRFRAVIF